MNFALFASNQEWFVFALCLLVGAFVILKYCADQFVKPTPAEESDPWKFVLLRLQTPRRQYFLGFLVYCGALLFIFFAVSLMGPGPILEIAKAIGAAATQTGLPAAAPAADAAWHNYPTFPILVAFYIVGINPNLPKALDFEVLLRRFAHGMAYIPRNMERVFNFMRFSSFELPPDKLNAAWIATDLHRPAIRTPELRNFSMSLDRAVALYAQAGTLAGDLALAETEDLSADLNLRPFTLYRDEIQTTGVNLQAIIARLDDLAGMNANDRMKAIAGLQRDLSRNLERLLVIFACAVAGQDMDRVAEGAQAVGFTSPFPTESEIPWNPILQAVGAAAAVLAISWSIAAQVFPNMRNINIPTDTKTIAWMLFVILAVHLAAISRTLRARERMIAGDRYYSDSGKGQAVAYVKIFLFCAAVCFPVYLVLNVLNFVSGVRSEMSIPSATIWNGVQFTKEYLLYWLAWTIVPAACGVLTAYTIDRPADTLNDRIVSGLLEGSVMAASAVLVLELTTDQIPLGLRVFTVVLYGGLGGVLAYVLPKAVRRYWKSRESHLPEKINALRMSVQEYFHSFQQFMDWLTRRNQGLGGKRPLDVLAEDGGMERLVALVSGSRPRIAAASG